MLNILKYGNTGADGTGNLNGVIKAALRNGVR